MSKSRPESVRQASTRPRRLFASARSRRATVLALTVFLLGVVAVGLALDSVRAFEDPARFRAWVLTFGPWTPVVFVTVQAAQVVLAPIPGQVLVVAGGYLFGPVLGTFYSLTGATAGSFVVFALARRWGRPFVERAVDADALALFDGLSADHGGTTLFLVFLFPGLPDDVVCFAAGLTEMDLRKLVAISVVGRLPGYVVLAVAGSELYTTPAVGVAVLVAAAVLAALGYRYRAALAARFGVGDQEF